MSIEVLQEGSGEIIGWHDPDENRQWLLENKPRDLRDKRLSVNQAVERFVQDSDFITFVGFGHICGLGCFEEYLERIGGIQKLNYLKRVEQLREPLEAPWIKGK